MTMRSFFASPQFLKKNLIKLSNWDFESMYYDFSVNYIKNPLIETTPIRSPILRKQEQYVTFECAC